MEKLEGYVEHIVFRNPQNGYTVLTLECGGEEVTCVGTFSAISVGEGVIVEGEYANHPTYGRQLKVARFEEKAPDDEDAIMRYLGSGAIKGIGPALAARIVKKFGADAFRVIEEEPERLAEVKGISEKKAMEVADQVSEKRDMRQAMIFLQQYGITMHLALKVYNAYGQEVYKVVRENPYRLADDVDGVGFRTADEIASRVGIRMDSDFRIRSGILYALQQAAGEGHTYLPEPELTRQAAGLLGLGEDDVREQYGNLAIEKKIVCTAPAPQGAADAGGAFSAPAQGAADAGGASAAPAQGAANSAPGETLIYSARFYHMERNVATMLRRLNVRYDDAEEEIEGRMREVEGEAGIVLDEMQAEAVREAARNGLLVITGGPGTGKTTTILSIIRYFEREGMEICLAAPTGRAAKRMSEATGCEARTIHRMLGPMGAEGAAFERNEDNPIEADVVIVDEASMIDISLMQSLLRAIAIGTRLILVGDADQLPSVGPGSVLRDIIRSGACSIVMLSRIFRQAAASDIIVNAHKINQGQKVALDNKSMDFFFLKRYDAESVIGVTLALVAKKLPKFVGATPFDVQVLTPMRKGLLGSVRLNGILQGALNPPGGGKREKEHGGVVFREGDKVMQIKNNYQLAWETRTGRGFVRDKGLGIFNGDMGVIRAINDFAETMTVEFDEGRVVEYPFGQLGELELSYAITIHKAQGSEYPAVVIPLLSGPALLMNRNLLYTAVTRAKKCVTLVGDEKTFYSMEQNASQQKRYSGLADRLAEG